jgi:hypothetical protein
MNLAVCTLFEGHYHYGVAALANSLFKHGFKGVIYAGYKGPLPFWSVGSSLDTSRGEGISSLKVSQDLTIHFVPVDTEYHLTNYKPLFMLKLWEGLAKEAEGMVYFDPDIVIKCRWHFYETWLSYGIALVHEITSNDMPVSHPIRGEWRKIIAKANRIITHEPNSYINAGFCGILKENFGFLQLWSDMITTAFDHFQTDPARFMTFDRTYPFFSVDQDALNIAAMCTEFPISEIGPEGMDFIHGGWTMSHAVGLPKPWKKHFLASALNAEPPSLAEKAYWLNVQGPVHSHHPLTVRIKQMGILAGSFIGRFYSKY